MNISSDMVIAMIGAGLGMLGIGYAMGQRKKLNDVSVKIDKSIDELSADIHVDLSDTVVERAVDRAVERESAFAVKRATDKLVKNIEDDINRQVKNVINDTYSDIRKSVVDETAKKVSQIDIQVLKNEVVKQAKEQVAKKFDGSLNDILEDFNRNLSHVSQIYQSIAQTFPNGKEVKFSLS